MSCPRFCCCCCCDNSKDDAVKQYPHIEYQAMTRLATPPQPKVVAEMPEFQQVPIKKIFQLPQRQTEYGVKPDFAADEVITQQPVFEKTGHVPHRSVSQSMEDSSSTVEHLSSPKSMVHESTTKSLSSLDIYRDRARAKSAPDVLKMGTSPASEKEVKLGPRLTFSLYYDIQRCVLTLTLFKAYDLPAKDRRGTSDPFVVMYLDPSREEIFQSRILYETLNPRFNEHFEFKNVSHDDIQCQTIVFKVFDHDKYSKNDFIGTSMLPLKDADLYGATKTIAIDETAVNSRSEKGELLVSLLYQPAINQLQGIILKATGLQKQDVVGQADPYVKVYMVRNNKRIIKWKTSVKKNTLVPVFNESFIFDVAMMDLSDISLEVVVMDYDRFSANDLVGVIIIGEHSPHESGRSHWEEIMVSPKHRVSRWHTIRPPQPGFKVDTLKRSE